MSKKQPLVSFVVLCWNGLEDIKKCLDSMRQVAYPNTEIIVVDNNSEDGSREYLRTLTDIRLLELPVNTGFSGGHIAGQKISKGEYLAIINSDLVVDTHWIDECLATFARHEDAAIVGGKAFKWNEDNPAYNTNNEFYSFQEVDPATGYTRTLLVGEEECTVDSISGAALLIKQSCLKSVGYFDDTFFAYYEETDLIARMMRKGFRAYYNPKAQTWHEVAGSTGVESEFYLYMMHRNRYMFAVKNLDEPYLRMFLKNWRREARMAYLRHVRYPHDLEAACRVKAYNWSRKNEALVMKKRAKVQKTGTSYVDHLKAAKHEDVTVIIPCHNYGQYVTEAINSALNQTIAPKKVIIINDGSTDDSKKRIDAFKDNPLVQIIHKKNTGVVDTKNLGIKLSQTYWTVFLDADDILAKSFIEKTLSMTGNGAKDIVYTDMQLFGAVTDIFRAKSFSTHTLLKTNYINNSALIKTTLLHQVGGYKAEMNHGLEDWELYISLVEASAKPQYLPLALVKYRQHQAALSRNTHVKHKERDLIQQIHDLHRGFYKKHGYYTTVAWHGTKLALYVVRYPGLIVVLLRAIPSGLKQALSHIYGKGLAYIQRKIGVVS